MKRMTGVSWPSLLQSARNMTAHGGSSLPETMLAAAAPVLLQRAVVSGDAEGGLMAAGQVVGRLTDLPSCADLLAAIETEARARLRAICGHDAPVLAGAA